MARATLVTWDSLRALSLPGDNRGLARAELLTRSTPTTLQSGDERGAGISSPQAEPARPAARTGLVAGVASARTFDSLHDRDFRWFFLATLSQNAAMNIQLLVRGFLVFQLTGSYAALGTMAIVHAISMLGVSLYGGVLADRRSKRMLLQGGQIVAALTAGAVALLLFGGLLRYEHLLIAAFAQGASSGLMMPARQSMAPEIVGLAQLQNAVALNTAGMNMMRLFGPAFAGLMLAIVDPEWIYVIMTALFLLSVVMLARVPKRTPAARSMRAAGAVEDLREGFAYILRTPTVFVLLSVSAMGSVKSQGALGVASSERGRGAARDLSALSI